MASKDDAFLLFFCRPDYKLFIFKYFWQSHPLNTPFFFLEHFTKIFHHRIVQIYRRFIWRKDLIFVFFFLFDQGCFNCLIFIFYYFISHRILCRLVIANMRVCTHLRSLNRVINTWRLLECFSLLWDFFKIDFFKEDLQLILELPRY